MAALMGDLIPNIEQLLTLPRSAKHQAALAVADLHSHDKGLVALHLVQLGLAEHQDDGSFTATLEPDGECWFTPAHDGTTVPYAEEWPPPPKS